MTTIWAVYDDNTAATAKSPPAGAINWRFTAVGPGGGGGGGRRGNAGSSPGGGGGGGGGFVDTGSQPIASLGSTYTITRGAVGAAGTSSATANTNGGNGGTGGDVVFTSGTITLTAKGGGGGGGGTTAAGTAGAAGTATTSNPPSGTVTGNGAAGGAGGSAAVGATGGNGPGTTGGAGGGGGGAGTSGTAGRTGGNGGTSRASGAGGTGGAATGAGGTTPTQAMPGTGGGGGGSRNGSGGAGGTGGAWGGGGGGGAGAPSSTAGVGAAGGIPYSQMQFEVPAQATSSVVDAFSSLSAWTTVGTATITSGHADITPGAFADSGIQTPTPVYDLTGSTLVFKVDSIHLGGATYDYVGLSPDGFGGTSILSGDGPGFLILGDGNGTGSHSLSDELTDELDAAWDPSIRPYLRLRESGGTVFYDYSSDGINWTNLTSRATDGNENGYVRVGSLSAGAYTSSFLTDSINILPVTGTVTATLLKATAALTAAQTSSAATGTVAATLLPATGALTGAQAQSGLVAATLLPATAAATGAQAQSGTVAATGLAATAALTGSAADATVTAALPPATAALTATQAQSGTIAATTLPATSAESGTSIPNPAGTVAAALPPTSAALTGAQAQAATIAATTPKATAALTGVEQPAGTITATPPPAVAALTGAQQQSGTITAALRPATTTAAGFKPLKVDQLQFDFSSDPGNVWGYAPPTAITGGQFVVYDQPTTQVPWDLVDSTMFTQVVSLGDAALQFFGCWKGPSIGASGFVGFYLQGGSVSATDGGTSLGSGVPFVAGMWLQLRSDGTDLFYEYGSDGTNWTVLYQYVGHGADAGLNWCWPLYFANGATVPTVFDNFNISAPAGAIASTMLPATAALTGLVPPKAETLFDDFSTLDSTKWQFEGNNVSGNQLHGPPGVGLIALTTTVYDLHDSYIMAELVQIDDLTTNAFLIAWTSAAYGAQIACWYITKNSPGNHSVFPYSNQWGVPGSMTYDPAVHRWLRMRGHADNTTDFDYSADGLNWTTFFTDTSQLHEYGRILPSLQADNQSSGGEVNDVIFDNFNLPPVTSTVAASTLPATAALSGTSVENPAGSVTAATLPVVAALTAAQTQAAVIAATTRPAVAAAGATEQPQGTIVASTLPAFAAESTSVEQAAAIAAHLLPAIAVLTAAEQPQGSVAATLAKAVAALAGTQGQAGTVAAHTLPARAAVTGLMVPVGLIAATLRPATMALVSVVILPVPPTPPVIPTGPSHQVITHRFAVTLHTATGVLLYQFAPSDQTACQWGRKLRDVSTLDLSAPPIGDVDRLPDLVPWVHWVSVWDADRDALLWTGPIQKATINRGGVAIAAGDHAALLTRTTNPTSKRWDAADPAWIADELWTAMLAHHGIKANTIVRPDPEGDRFDYKVVTDAQMLDQTIGNLVQMGLRWTVVAGVPILGPMPLDPIASLDGDRDFLGDGPDLVIDGSATFNDVLVRGPDNLARAHVDLAGQSLQTIVNVDSMFGVSNVTAAAAQYARHTGTIRKVLDVPAGTRLHPEAPVSIDELIPSARFVIDAYGIRQLVELTSLDVEMSSSGVSGKVSMSSVDEKIELADILAKNGATGVVR